MWRTRSYSSRLCQLWSHHSDVGKPDGRDTAEFPTPGPLNGTQANPRSLQQQQNAGVVERDGKKEAIKDTREEDQLSHLTDSRETRMGKETDTARAIIIELAGATAY